MATLVYSPQIQVHVDTARSGIIDLSEDLTQWQLDLRENAPHTFSCTLQNAQRKYDGQILPMDRISVKLKRINWLQAFTGYINEAPIFQAWPGTIDLSATCTLKIPQFWSWDPTTQAAQALILAAFDGASVDNTTPDPNKQNGVNGAQGITKLVTDILTKVVGWDPQRIHIGAIPDNWFKWAEQVTQLVGADEALYKALGAGYVAAGTADGNLLASLPPGTYGPDTLDATQAHNASIVYSTCQQMKAPSYITTMTLMTAIDESHFLNYGNASVIGSLALPHDAVGTDHGSVGVFQQQPSEGWGTVEQCQDVAQATKTFVTRLTSNLQGRVPSPSIYGLCIQRIQVSAGDGSNYQRFLGEAQAIQAKLDAAYKVSASGGAGTTATIGNGYVVNPGTGYKASGAQIAQKAMDLIQAHIPPTGAYISYQEGGDDPADTDIANVTTLDCSSLVDWVYYQSTGEWLSGAKGQRDDVAGIIAHCPKQVDFQAAYNIQGAVFTKGADDHTGISLGNGKTHVAAHQSGVPAPQQVNISPIDGNGFDRAWLLPGVDYSQSATTKMALTALRNAKVNAAKLGTQITAASDPTAPSGNTPFLSLLTNMVVNPLSSTSPGMVLAGPFALLNDEPLLPWLQTVINGTMRSFCSSPSGDFIAWFPDYFGLFGQPGVLKIQLIELQDFTVTWSDQQMVTHQFVIGNPGMGVLDQTSGAIGLQNSTLDLISLAMQSVGVASFDYPEIFKVIYGQTAPPGYIDSFLSRFGARPDVQQMPYIAKGASEFFMALYLFVQRWAAQFTASVPLTFMPEAFPGMLIQIPEYGFQAYVQGVTHSGSYGSNGGFQTTLDICAPSNVGGSDRTDLLSLLPIASTTTDSGPSQARTAKKTKKP